jgi:hypothetical protein
LLSVNWKDGMLVEARHLLEQEGYLDEMVRWSLAHALTGYGLVPPRAGQPDPLAVEVAAADGQASVRVRRCMALLPSGLPVQVQADDPIEQGGTPPLEIRFPLPGGPRRVVPLALEASPGEKIEVGPVDAEAEPPRPAYRTAALRLSVEAADGPPSPWRLPLAEIEIDGGRVALSPDYIPPCLTLAAHPALRVAARRLIESLHGVADRLQAVAIQQAGSSDGRVPGLTPLARFSRDLALRSCVEFSILQDGQESLAPAEVARAAKRFLRYARLMLDLHPEVLRGSWHDYLGSAPEGIKDHGVFVRRVEEALTAPHRPDRLREELAGLGDLAAVLSGFAAHLASGDVRERPKGDFLDYNRQRYQAIPWAHIEQARDDRYSRVRISGFEPRTCAELLVWIRIPRSGTGGAAAAELRGHARTTRLGINENAGYGAMSASPVDMEFDPDVAVIIFYNRNQETIKRLNITATSAFDFSSLSLTPNEDIRLYYR